MRVSNPDCFASCDPDCDHAGNVIETHEHAGDQSVVSSKRAENSPLLAPAGAVADLVLVRRTMGVRK